MRRMRERNTGEVVPWARVRPLRNRPRLAAAVRWGGCAENLQPLCPSCHRDKTQHEQVAKTPYCICCKVFHCRFVRTWLGMLQLKESLSFSHARSLARLFAAFRAFCFYDSSLPSSSSRQWQMPLMRKRDGPDGPRPGRMCSEARGGAVRTRALTVRLVGSSFRIRPN